MLHNISRWILHATTAKTCVTIYVYYRKESGYDEQQPLWTIPTSESSRSFVQCTALLTQVR